MANIRQVAQRAEVSISTVSHVLNQTRPVSDAVRKRVLDAAAQLEYYPNYFARSLAAKRSGTVGMVILDITNPYFAEVVRGAEMALRAAHYNLIICNTDGHADIEEECIRLLMGRKVDGIIAAVTSKRWAALQRAQARGFPLIFVDHLAVGMEGRLVGVDNERGTFDAIAHLVADGHRRIALLIGPTSIGSMRERLAGYYRAVRELDLPMDDQLVRSAEMTTESAAAAMTELLAQPERPSAVFLANNVLALGALHALDHLGLRCPDDIGLASFDDVPWMRVSDPHLTAVRQPTYEIGALAGRLLLQAIEGSDVPESPIRMQPTLVVRASCRADRHGVARRRALD